MKRFKICWGNWNSSSAEVPAYNVSDAINVACEKHSINVSVINSVTFLGSW